MCQIGSVIDHPGICIWDRVLKPTTCQRKGNVSISLLVLAVHVAYARATSRDSDECAAQLLQGLN